MNYRGTAWLNEKTFTVVYGIQARWGGPWVNLAENGRPLFFDHPEDRDQKLADLRRANRARNAKGGANP